jgi:HEAT repeat protein
MRRLVALGLLAAIIGLCSVPLPAQVLKTEKGDKKGDKKVDKKDPKDVKVDPKDEIKWPKLIQGKNLDAWVKEMRESPDASSREQAIRTVPLFGPSAIKAASGNLLSAIKNEKDANVRLAAVQAVPILGFDKPDIEAGLTSMTNIIKPSSGFDRHFRMETIVALAACGPIAKRAIPDIASGALKDSNSWQMRKTAAFALGRLGQPMKEDEGPDPAAVVPLAKVLELGPQGEPSHLVRKEIISALILLGPPHVEAAWRAERTGLTTAMKDHDHIVIIWAHVAFIRTEQELIKANDPHLAAVAKYLSHHEPTIRLEAIQAIGSIGNEAKSKWQEVSDIVDKAAGTVAKTPKDEVKGEDVAFATSGLWALSQMTDETGKILPVIDPLKRHPDENIKRAAENAYKALTQNPKDPVVDPKKGPAKQP